MEMSRELKLIALIAAGMVATRFVILALDAIAESVERRTLYR